MTMKNKTSESRGGFLNLMVSYHGLANEYSFRLSLNIGKNNWTEVPFNSLTFSSGANNAHKCRVKFDNGVEIALQEDQAKQLFNDWIKLLMDPIQ